MNFIQENIYKVNAKIIKVINILVIGNQTVSVNFQWTDVEIKLAYNI